ncbi:MAG: hypothetical protein WC805_02305 [Patescibacteria group bacterium]|jgi:hypothetical protein
MDTTIIDFMNALKMAVWNFLTEQLLPIGAVLAALVIIWGGWLYIQNRPEEGKKTIGAAILGLIIMALALLIINTVITLFG